MLPLHYVVSVYDYDHIRNGTTCFEYVHRVSTSAASSSALPARHAWFLVKCGWVQRISDGQEWVLCILVDSAANHIILSQPSIQLLAVRWASPRTRRPVPASRSPYCPLPGPHPQCPQPHPHHRHLLHTPLPVPLPAALPAALPAPRPP